MGGNTLSCGCLKRGKTNDFSEGEQIKPCLEICFEPEEINEEVMSNARLWKHVIKFDENDLARLSVDKPEPHKKRKERKETFNPDRDDKTRWYALERAGHRCEIDGNHPTFISRDKNVPYTEPHHLIPLKYSEHPRFLNINLDVPANIVSLCSNCHNQLHYGKDIKQMLKRLYDSRRERLLKAGIDISFEELLSMYAA